MNFLNKIFLRITGGGLSYFDQSQISKGTLQSVFIQGISMILVFMSNLLWVKLLGPEDYGIFVHIFNWVAILSIVALGGKEDLVLAELPKYHEQNDTGKIGFLIEYANKRTFIRSVFLTIFFLLLVYFVPIRSLTEYRSNFLFASAAIFLSAYIILNQVVLQALHKVKLGQLVDRILKPMLLILVALYIARTNFPANTQTVIVTNVGVLAICAILLFLIVNRFHHSRLLTAEPTINRELSRKTVFFFLISLLYILSTRLNMLVLSYFDPGMNTGIFNICYRFAELLIFPYYLLHFVLPQLFSRNNLSGVSYNQSLFSAATRFSLLLTIPLLILVLAFGKLLLNWFGHEFNSGYNCLVYLSLGQSLFALAGPCNTILMTQDKEKYAAFALLIYCIVLAITNLTLIPAMGITGSGLASLLSCFVYNLLLIKLTYRQSKVLSPVLTVFNTTKKPASSQ